jgi:hypothetical protein
MSDLIAGVAGSLTDRAASKRLEWHDDPVGFCRDCIDWPPNTRLEDYQGDILAAVAQSKRVAVRSPHGTGKTTTEALVLLWFAVTRDAASIDWKVVTTAGAWRQLERYLWPEVHLWARRLRPERIGRATFNERNELQVLSLSLYHGSAFAVAATDPSLIEGAHAESLLYIFDESKSIAPEIFDAAEGAFSGPGETFALACSTPGSPAGRFYDIHARKPGLDDWATRAVTLEEAITAGRISSTWAEQRARQWGETSALYKNRVLGEFAVGDEDGCIPLPWVELANARWEELQGDGWGPATSIGVDVARSGRDKTCLAIRNGNAISELRTFAHGDTMQTTGRVAALLRAHPNATASVDIIGIGAGVFDSLREQGLKPSAFNASAKADGKDRSGELGFLNLRAEAWWHLREELDPAFGATLALPPDDQLIADLVTPHYTETSRGLIQIEGKDEIRKRLGRSTDSADAVVMACFDKVAMTPGAAWMKYMEAMRDTGGDASAARRLLEAETSAPELEDVAECEDPDCPNEFNPVAGTTLEQCVKCKLYMEVDNG